MKERSMWVVEAKFSSGWRAWDACFKRAQAREFAASARKRQGVETRVRKYVPEDK